MARRVWVDDDPFAPRDGSAGPRTAPGGSQLLVRRISLQDDAEVHLRGGAAPSGETQDPWPLSVPAIADLVVRGLALNTAITVLVGDNGSGKSTLVEALAEAWGFDMRGGHGARLGAHEPRHGGPVRQRDGGHDRHHRTGVHGHHHQAQHEVRQRGHRIARAHQQGVGPPAQGGCGRAHQHPDEDAAQCRQHRDRRRRRGPAGHR